MRAFLSLALFAVALPAAAQTTFGVKLGINAATVSSSDDQLLGVPDIEQEGIEVDKQARLGFAGGLTADVPISPALSFRPEILYSQKGYAAEIDIDSGTFGGIQVPDINGTATFKVDYLEVPLMLAYRFPSQSALDVAVEIGPSLAYKLSTGVDCSGNLDDGSINIDFLEISCEEEDSDADTFRDFDLGGALGLTIGSGPFGVGLRYTNSILSITEELDGSDDNEARNQVFTVTGHYRFGAGR